MDNINFDKIWKKSGMEDAINSVKTNKDTVDHGMPKDIAIHFEHIATLKSDEEVIAYMQENNIWPNL